VVLGLFQQTARKSASVEALAESFGSRLTAMAAANTAILRTSGGGAALADLAQVQLGPFIETGRLQISGGPLIVPDRLAQPLALAFNELATNAIKYGALSNEAGIVELSWAISLDHDSTVLAILWEETGGPPVLLPTRTGVGSRLIDKGILGATVRREFLPSGFICSIKVPIRP